MVGNVTDVQ
ncbi:putative pleckstrin proteiny domain family B member 2, partial [Danaus plexippus plexippus]